MKAPTAWICIWLLIDCCSQIRPSALLKSAIVKAIAIKPIFILLCISLIFSDFSSFFEKEPKERLSLLFGYNAFGAGQKPSKIASSGTASDLENQSIALEDLQKAFRKKPQSDLSPIGSERTIDFISPVSGKSVSEGNR